MKQIVVYTEAGIFTFPNARYDLYEVGYQAVCCVKAGDKILGSFVNPQAVVTEEI